MKKIVNESLISFLNEDLKDELITKLIQTIYKKNSEEEKIVHRKYLKQLEVDELDRMLQDYYLNDIKNT
jgi:hypothetical protein